MLKDKVINTSHFVHPSVGMQVNPCAWNDRNVVAIENTTPPPPSPQFFYLFFSWWHRLWKPNFLSPLWQPSLAPFSLSSLFLPHTMFIVFFLFAPHFLWCPSSQKCRRWWKCPILKVHWTSYSCFSYFPSLHSKISQSMAKNKTSKTCNNTNAY